LLCIGSTGDKDLEPSDPISVASSDKPGLVLILLAGDDDVLADENTLGEVLCCSASIALTTSVRNSGSSGVTSPFGSLSSLTNSWRSNKSGPYCSKCKHV